MSGDGPLSIERNATSDADGPLHKIHYGTEYGWLTDDEVDAVADQLNRARRCAEAETNLLLCSLALSSMEDERDDARAERDAALDEIDRLNQALAYTSGHDRTGEDHLDEMMAMAAEVDPLRAENARLRADLAARPDLTELRAAHSRFKVRRWNDSAVRGVILAVDRLLAADPAPAPDTVTITDCDPQCCQDWPNGHAYDCPQVTAARAAPEADR